MRLSIAAEIVWLWGKRDLVYLCPMNYWLLKSEPETYAWDDLLAKGEDHWDGVRNYQARNYLQAMKKGDLALFYHSGKERRVVGICEVVREAYPDPTTTEPQWVAVDVRPVCSLKQAVTLAQIKSEEKLAHIPLVRQSRLSVMPLQQAEFDCIVAMGKKEL